jgi:hypothetical protein
LPKRYNLFIDGQNVHARNIPDILDYCGHTGLAKGEAKLYAATHQIGELMTRGTVLADHDIDPVPVPCKKGKNSVDIRIAVDVIEEACRAAGADSVILVTNDSDFTHVASRVISYGADFHLLYTQGAPPTGYSSKVKLSKLGVGRSRGSDFVEKVKNAAARLKPMVLVQPPAAPALVQFQPDPDYRHALPLADLSAAGFVSRILAASPTIIDSRALFLAWKDFAGRAWKGKGSKKSAQQFFDEQFPQAGYRFFEWPGLPPNQGYFLRPGSAILDAPGGARNPVLSMLGAERELLMLQAEIIAQALRSGDHPDFNHLYEACGPANVLPRYGAWGIVYCWRKSTSPSGLSPVWQDRIELDEKAVGAALVKALDAEIRRQFETGEVALVSSDDPISRDAGAIAATG